MDVLLFTEVVRIFLWVRFRDLKKYMNWVLLKCINLFKETK